MTVYTPPFEEWDHILVPSSYGEWNNKKRFYRVSYGVVSWREADPGGMHIACFPIVQFGNTEDYHEVKKQGNLPYYPCHVLIEDRDKVKLAEEELIKRNSNE